MAAESMRGKVMAAEEVTGFLFGVCETWDSTEKERLMEMGSQENVTEQVGPLFLKNKT